MVSEDHKCIFVHIPGTAGSTIEHAIIGGDQWYVNPLTKHCPLSIQYKYYLQSPREQYFKFSIVRHPFERIRSLWRFHSDYPFYLNDNGEIEIDSYYNTNLRINVEQIPPGALRKHFSIKHEYLVQDHHKPDTLYLNTIDQPVDKIYKFEQIDKCFNDLSERFSIPLDKFKQVHQASSNKPPLSENSKNIIRKIQKVDFEVFDYDPN